MGGQMSTDNCYFSVQGFDMNGANIKKVQDFKNQKQAIQYAKDRIGVNESLCGVVKKENNGNYSVSVKPIIKSNPTNNENNWHRCLNIFYGKRLGHNVHEQKFEKGYCVVPQIMRHFMVNVDMYGGDLQQIEYSSFQEAYNHTVKMINLDSAKCATIVDFHIHDKWLVCLKDPKKTNPSQSSNHHLCQTVFVGKEI